MTTDPLQPLDDPDHPVLTMSQAAELLGVQAAFLRSLDSSGVLHPHRSPGGHRRYSRHQLQLAARVRVLLDDGHLLASAQVIVQLEDDLADARDQRDAALRDRHPVAGEQANTHSQVTDGSQNPPKRVEDPLAGH
ncbi:helix-turn-helix domain-containing protein [Modestobacter versicolor]|uniref:DNA-binding transcriptional MerR regulator n=1 Tax=Modestobacter versicolor TaxID=429133 RepID=A0A323VM93_9ACTN|nr:helix-turn-helix domain-containing protein [Modestobacter versicolor]MBB3674458.1 DNA-binding transcriptional MerR regulator [Modestobacter versicolor]PZA20798.1 transcriptional regulator [Modestobacter versicolor]